MGESDLTYSSSAAAWINDFEVRQRMIQWRHMVDGDTMSGGLFDQATGGQIRNLSATRWKDK